MRPWPPAVKLAAALLPICLPAQEAVFRVDVSLVRILATVKDGQGRPVGSLDKDDFEVRDNGAPQTVTTFERSTELPLSVALMVDSSASTGIEAKYQVQSVSRFLKALFSEGNPKDAAALYTFNYEVTRRNYFTRNAQPIEESLRLVKNEAGTAMYDAIYLGSQDLENRDGRRVMVLVTDGGDTSSGKDFHAALEAAQIGDAVIYAVLVLPITNNPGRNTGGEHALALLTSGTGGRVFAPSGASGMESAFLEILRDLRTQYLLGYYPKNVPLSGNRFHKLEVGIKRPGLRVSARNGYYGEAAAQPEPARGKVSIVPK
ncbi:MAG: VWA domain-containing protein [Bryobacteraceae bacterium]